MFIALTEYMLPRKVFLDYNNLFSPNDNQKVDKTIDNYFKDFRFKKDRWNKKLLFRGNKKSELKSQKHKKMCKVLSYFEHFLIAVNGFILIPVFASLVGIYVGIASFEVRVKISAVTAGIKSCKSIVKNKRKHHDHILLFARLSKF